MNILLCSGAQATEKPIIYIHAINPGYTIDGQANVGEMIVLSRSDSSDTPISLASLKIGYTNSSGNSVNLLEFPDNSWMTGESILLRLSGSSQDEPAHLTYAKTLALKAGPLTLTLNDEVIDSVCWTGKEGCEKAFQASKPTTLVRDAETFTFSHEADFIPEFQPSSYYEEVQPEEVIPKQCASLEFTEILTYFENSQSEQFVELFNPTTEQILLNGCKLRYKNKYYELDGVVLPDAYFSYYPREFSFTKVPTSTNQVELIDTDGEVVGVLNYDGGMTKATSFARIGFDGEGQPIWRNTYQVTPGEPNEYQQFRSCPEGKVINETTGNCVKVVEVEEKTCDVGYYLNEETGRCRKIPVEETKECEEGYYLNPDTNRCKKIIKNDGAEFPVVPETFSSETSFVALYAVIGIAALGVVYIVFQFRKEIMKFFRKVFRRSH